MNGQLDDRTAVAVLEFQKWSGLPRDGVLGAATLAALRRATRPRPVTSGVGRRVEVLLDRQLALLVEGRRVVRAVHISSGAGGATPTGSFRVYRKEEMSWSVPFSVWMPWASYFVGGIAFHEYPVVPAYPASHGCVRVNSYDAVFFYSFATYGTPVLRARELELGRVAAACALVALLPAAYASAAPPVTERPGELVVALSLPRPAFQVGAVRGGEVILAKGLEVELARAIARRLGVRPRFVQVGDASASARAGSEAAGTSPSRSSCRLRPTGAPWTSRRRTFAPTRSCCSRAESSARARSPICGSSSSAPSAEAAVRR